ncbi:uncharacterized protein DUF3307 [Flavobacteriaceae bacterium MAR_2010_72]|nr:uncharacterized protein DUF3307 [Flavobacteriaceae bacterium MAR_2010_72]TVZ59995.1 uncharacterized protein DUF3307 [Flavobacteriaceae bacterium MAR_2010_105]
MLALCIKLILAHVIGDFVLQPLKWVRDKEEKKHRSKYLYWHVCVHLLALIVVLKADFSYWLGILIIIVSHFGIDVLKLHLHPKGRQRLLFGLDQLAHVIVIALVVQLYEPYSIDLDAIFSTQLLLLITCIICITKVSSIIMKVIISKWKLEEDMNEESLADAGAYIGILERLFVFAFIIMNYWEGIGFLIAAKSVFRFGDLSRSKDRKLTEYILIGTLISFGLAIVFGLGYIYISELI